MRNTLPILSERDRFDEAGYLRLYPQVRAAIAAGTVATAWQHYDTIGRHAGCRTNDLDPDFYRSTYPQAEAAFGPLSPDECVVHFAAFGRARGYLPHRHAARLVVADGGWTDAADALDRIDGLAAIGRITDRQAAMLRSWRQDGMLLLDRPAPRDRVEPAALDLERLFAGALPDLLFDCPRRSAAPLRWQPEMAPAPAAALDPHDVSAPMRALLLGDPLPEFLHLLFDSPALLAASRGFLRPPVTPPRRESLLFGCTIPRRFVALWLALEDDVGLTVWPASHRLPPVPVAGFANLPDALRLGLATPAEAVAQYDAALADEMRAAGQPATTLCLKRGEVVLLHPDLVHAPPPLPPLATARGLAAQLCPAALLPGYAERRPARLSAEGSDWFTAGFRCEIGPLS